MGRFRKATISDVARRAGVSITTVSLFVGGRESVCSPETAGRIRDAIAALHYTPSSLVSSVQRRATLTLGVCVHSPLDPGIDFGGLFFERLWRGIVAEADAAGYSLLHYPAAVRVSHSTDALLDGRVDGLLYHTHPRCGDDPRPERLAAAGMPTVYLTRSRDLPAPAGAAFADERQTAALALEHLWSAGHRRIAFVAGPGGDIADGRRDGYREWLTAHDAYDPALEADAGAWRLDDERAASLLAGWAALPEPPTAVFAVNDPVALALYRQRPDLSIVGVDNTAEALAAGLDTVEPPDEAVGRASVRVLLSLLQGASGDESRIAVPVTRLHARRSVASPPPPGG